MTQASLVEALIRKIAEVQIWRDVYHDGPDMMSGELKLTPDDVRTARAALASPVNEALPHFTLKTEGNA